MNKFIMNYDAVTGDILGFYLEDMHNVIPTPNIEITEDQHNFYMAIENNGKYRINITTLAAELIPYVPVVEAKSDIDILKDQIGAMQDVLMQMI